MERKIRSELLKMYAIMLVLAGLGVYAHSFVYAGIMAKAALNLSIFALFGVAAYLAFRHVWNLKNEVLALKALQVDYGTKTRRPLDPYKHPAIVFQEPELLGQGYRMIAEELSKQNAFQISNATAQTLLHDVDQRINDRKSTIMYFSGLMVFLGLLGAFMGLMKTVGSVGDLIGGMDISGAGGTDSFGKLIEGMKGPLNGMSVGFSSSLFGLMTSMVLGALERCMTSAMKTLRNEFEHWLSNVAALENPHSEAHQQAEVDLSGVIRALELGGRHLRDLRETVLDQALAQQESQQAITKVTNAVADLSKSVERVTDPGPMLQPIADCVAELARNQAVMVSQFHGLFTLAERDRATIREMLDTMQANAGQRAALDGPHLHAQIDRLVSLQSALVDQGPPVVNVTSIANRPRGWFGGLFQRGESTEATPRKERRQLRTEMRRMLVSQRKMMRDMRNVLGETVGTVEAGRKRDQNLLSRMLSQNDVNQARLSVLMERLRMLDEGQEGTKDTQLLSGLHGARMEMDVLRRRLNLTQERDDEGEPTAPREAPGHQADGTNG